MKDQVILKQEDIDRFCIEELVLRSAGIRHALAEFGKGSAGPELKVRSRDLATIVSELRSLRDNANNLSDQLQAAFQEAYPEKTPSPPLRLVNPVQRPRRYVIENVLEKLAGPKT